MNMKKLLATLSAVASIASCSGDGPSSPSPFGVRQVTPKNGLVFYSEKEEPLLGRSLDQSVDAWVAWRVGLGESEAESRAVVAGCTVQLYFAGGVPGNGAGHAEYWWPNNLIELAVWAGTEYDPHTKMHLSSLTWLIHGLTHAKTGRGDHSGFVPSAP